VVEKKANLFLPVVSAKLDGGSFLTFCPGSGKVASKIEVLEVGSAAFVGRSSFVIVALFELGLWILAVFEASAEEVGLENLGRLRVESFCL